MESEAGLALLEAAVSPACDPHSLELGHTVSLPQQARPVLWERVTCVVTVQAWAQPTKALGLGRVRGDPKTSSQPRSPRSPSAWLPEARPSPRPQARG